jgi:Na+-transporting methylmalonyl-CoA/oxaloacetate decarboxylase gamma subunit
MENHLASVDWGQAFSIVGGGLVAVFFIMSILAVTTHLMGKIFANAAKKKEADQGGEAKS